MLVNLKITGVRNPRSVKPIVNQFTISSFTQEQYAIDKGIILDEALGLEVIPADLVQASLLQPDANLDQIITGALSTYEFSVTLNNGLMRTLGKLELNLAAEVDITDGSSCVAFEEGTFIQLSCEVVKLSEIQKLVVTHSNSDTDFKKSTLIIKVQNSIRNPSTSKESSFFTIHSYLLDEASGQYFLVD